jgi:predicted nucleotidyltransferase
MAPGIHGVDIPCAEIASFCTRNHIRKLSLFGSILTDRFRPDSDVDVLAEFEPDHIPGFFGLARMEQDLSRIIGRMVDLRTPEDLSRHFRDQVVAGAVVQYER